MKDQRRTSSAANEVFLMAAEIGIAFVTSELLLLLVPKLKQHLVVFVDKYQFLSKARWH